MEPAIGRINPIRFALRSPRMARTAGLVFLVTMAGCGPNADSRPTTPVPPADGAVAPPPPPPPAAPVATSPAPTTAPPSQATVVTADDPVKGKRYGGGIITEPLHQRFHIAHRIIFEIQIPDAMRLYKASDPNNRGPKSHEEFMERIIKENGIELPKLPAGNEYFFDAESEQLMMRHP